MLPSNPTELLNEGLRELGIQDTAGIEKLRCYVAELERWNSKLGLVHATGSQLIVRHILDSVAGLSVVRDLQSQRDNPVLADVGTGGGLPGIPLACFLGANEVLLVERSASKCGFLRAVLLVCGIDNARVVQADVSEMRETATVLVFRAFRPLTSETCDSLLKHVRPGGALCAYKGRHDRIAAELATNSGDDTEPVGEQHDIQVVPVHVPFLSEERHLVVIRVPEPGEGS